jgi:hypothetical protein
MFAYRSCATSSSQQQRQVHLESFFYAETNGNNGMEGRLNS